MLAQITQGELTTQAAGSGTETLRTSKHCTNGLRIHLGYKAFWKQWTFFLVKMWTLVFDIGGNYFLTFLNQIMLI